MDRWNEAAFNPDMRASPDGLEGCREDGENHEDRGKRGGNCSQTVSSPCPALKPQDHSQNGKLGICNIRHYQSASPL